MDRRLGRFSSQMVLLRKHTAALSVVNFEKRLIEAAHLGGLFYQGFAPPAFLVFRVHRPLRAEELWICEALRACRNRSAWTINATVRERSFSNPATLVGIFMAKVSTTDPLRAPTGCSGHFHGCRHGVAMQVAQCVSVAVKSRSFERPTSTHLRPLTRPS